MSKHMLTAPHVNVCISAQTNYSRIIIVNINKE